LQRRLANESSGAVKAQLKTSIQQLTAKRAAASPGASTLDGARYVVQLGNMKNGTNVRGGDVGSIMRSAAKARASTLKGALVVDGADPTTKERANQRRLPVLLLDGTLTRLSQGASNGSVMVQAQVEFVARRVPQETLSGTFSGAATTVDSAQALS